jgi:hypothetical protein
MEVDEVSSSVISGVAYDADTQILVLGFNNGTVYEYQGVPAAVHRELLEAESAGRYYGRRIRDRYPARRLPR